MTVGTRTDAPSAGAPRRPEGAGPLVEGRPRSAGADDRLRGVLAHEIAHDDLGHVARAQARGAGLGIGMILLDQVFPGSGQITPIAGALITRSYSRQEEYEADRHGVDLLRRAGYSKELMIDTLTWMLRTAGPSGGGFLATHPGTQERIDALEKLQQGRV